MDGRTILRLTGPVAAVLGAWAVFGWTMPKGDISDARARIETAEAAIAAGNAQLAGGEDRGEEADALAAQLERYELAVPTDIDQAGLFRRFDALGEQYGVSLGSVQITEDESGTTGSADTAAMAFSDPTAATPTGADGASADGVSADGATAEGATDSTMPPMPGSTDATTGASLALRVLRISADVTGPYTQVLDFVDALRASPRLLVIDQLSMVPDSEDPSIVSVNLSLRAFAQPAIPATPAGDPMAGDPMAGTASVTGSMG
ncbi:MAG: hypothetical protein MUE34_02465 [Acidimicrobiales bacterium]|nr:hypothetical protein [Acidimicrobiales bacterium]